MPRNPSWSLARDLFEQAGRALFGTQWRADMARLLEARQVQRVSDMAQGRRPVRAEYAERVAEALEDRAAAAAALARQIRDRLADAPPPAPGADPPPPSGHGGCHTSAS